MSDIKNETLSVLMDGELDEISLRRVLNQMDDEPELKETWSRFHLQRDVIKGDVSEFSTLDISGAIHDVIKDEDALKSDVQPSKTWWKTVAGLSVAASVTFAGKTQVQIVVPDITRVKTATMIAQSTNDLNTIDEESLQQAQKRLNTYLKQHAQDSALGQGRSAMPFARVVNFETPARQVKGN
jgi:sigma-E factor negative regulatory protein RseA